MPSALTPTFDHLTNTRIWFANVDAFNNFIEGITYTIAAANLPPSTLLAIGGVKAITNTPYTPPVVNPTTYLTIANDEGSAQVASKIAYDELKAQVTYMNTAISTLMTALANAGIAL